MFDLVSSFTGRIRSSTQDMMFTLAIYAVVGLLGLTAYVALLYALGLVISAEAGPLAAALSIAGITIGLALVGLLIVYVRQRRLRRLRQLRARSSVSAGSTAVVATLVPMMVRASPVGSLMAVAAVAYVLSRAGQRPMRDK
jgi:hypothetical protein